ncbi:dihydrodipicolinate synthase family protein [Paenibacillus sp. 22594]|uniref:dihydrodipicolinate synthase family protein n=1 Tax=Paenibacillus sp. 22594 TaxID=3453947 RepID=UPI003F84DC67
MVQPKSLTSEQYAALHDGLVIPAHPLALTADRQLDVRRQRALTRYYISSGAGGIAVAVHSTQFEIRDPQYGLFETVLRLAAEEVERANLQRPFLKIAGICGPQTQALQEAETAAGLGYDIGLVSLGGLPGLSEEEHLTRIRAVAEVLPVFGFYLQPSVGGMTFSYEFWRVFSEIKGVVGIKMAPFNRYQTLDVVRAVCHSNRRDEIALYTGNDDNIVNDLLTEYRFSIDGLIVTKRIVGGLLGHWAFWTRNAVDLLERIKKVRRNQEFSQEWLTLNVEMTDCNAAFFDPAHDFHGCIPGIHEVLRRQGLLEGRWCLNPQEDLSGGQAEEIDRVYNAYPHLNDDDFVADGLELWLKE